PITKLPNYQIIQLPNSLGFDRLRRFRRQKANRTVGAVAERLAMRVAAPAQRERPLRNLVLVAHPIDQRHIVAFDQIGSVFSHFDRRHVGYPIFCIAARKSAFDLVFPSLSSNSSIASTCESGLRTFRSTQMRFRSSRGSSSSSFRVPLLRMSIA